MRANTGGGHWKECQECVKNKTEQAILWLRYDRYLKGYGLNRLFNKNVMFFASSRNTIRQNIEKYDLFSKYSLQIAPPGTFFYDP
jgi:aspartyl/asparaginyl beta-hydroxylase (cupin superfamily)